MKNPLGNSKSATPDFDLVLTKDILFLVFTLLSRRDLSAAGSVSRKWNAVSKDQYFRWITVFSHRSYISVGEPKKGKISQNDLQIIKNPHKSKNNFLLVDKKGKHLETISWFNPFRWDAFKWPPFVDIFDLFQNYPKLWRHYIEVSSGDVLIHTEIHIGELELMLKRQEEIPGGKHIANVIVEEDQKFSLKQCEEWPNAHKSPHNKLSNSIQATQPPNMTVELYQYQMDAVAWMKSIEIRIHNKNSFPCADVVLWRSARTDVCVDSKSKQLIATQQLPSITYQIHAKGGVLADEMGLGKTVEFIGLIMENSSPSWKDLPEIEHEISTDQEFSKLRFKSRATLVLCPNHVAQQWHDEFKKISKANLKILRVTTIPELSKCTYKDLMHADVVIASYQLLKNPRYFRLGNSSETASNPHAGEELKRYTWIKSSLEAIRKNKGEAQSGPAPLEHFYWYRLIVDEGHEVINDTFYYRTLAMYDAKVCWYVSGTPFPNQQTLVRVLSFLNFPQIDIQNAEDFFNPRKSKQTLVPENALTVWRFADILKNHLYWRSTKESVGKEYETAPVVEELIALSFTDMEYVMYADLVARLETTLARKLCSQLPKIEGGSSLTRVRDFELTQKKKFIEENSNSCAQFTKELKALEGTKSNQRIQQQIPVVKQKVQKFAIKIKHEGKVLEQLIQCDTPESRFLKVCQALNMEPPSSLTKAMEKKSKVEKDLLKQYAQEIDIRDQTRLFDNFSQTTAFAYSKERKKKMTMDRINHLTIARLKEELRIRNVIPPVKGSKEDYRVMLRQQVQKENGAEVAEKPAEPAKSSQTTLALGKGNNNNAKKDKEPDSEEEEVVKKATKKRKSKKEMDSDSEMEEVLPEPSKAKKKRGRDAEEEAEVEQPASKKAKQYDLSKKRTNMELLEELMNLIEQYGTKMANVVYYLRRLWEQTPEARVILFSQFDPVLKEVGQILNQTDIKTSFVTGNVMRKNKAINSFRSTEDVQVILLGTEKAASGTNLIEASHIILMDPVTGSKEKVQTIESQAIGRADRQGQSKQLTVVRFIIQNTLEERDYVQNYLESKKELFVEKQKDLGEIHKAIAEVSQSQAMDNDVHAAINNDSDDSDSD